MNRSLPTGPRHHIARLAGPLLVASLCLTGLPAAGAAQPDAAPAPPQAEVQVALRTSGRCGDFVDHLPPLVMERDAGPGLTTASVGVCIRNAGKAEGRITIGIEHVQEHDVACSPDEAPVDASCGGGQPGEIGSSLRQVVDVDRDCKARVPTETDVAFLDLGSSPLVISESLRPKKTTCVELRLRYVADGAAAVRAQSDTIRWEYVIALTSN